MCILSCQTNDALQVDITFSSHFLINRLRSAMPRWLLLLLVLLPFLSQAQVCLTRQDLQIFQEMRECDRQAAKRYGQAEQSDPLSIKLSGQAFLSCTADFRENRKRTNNTALRKLLMDMSNSFEPMGELMIAISTLNTALRNNNLNILSEVARTMATSDARNLLSSVGSLVALQQRIDDARSASRRIYPEFRRSQEQAIDDFNAVDLRECK